MYKDHIKKWGLAKNHRAAEMRAIVRKRKQRVDQGKDSTFSVRGKPVEDDELVRYFKRKRLTLDEVLAQRQTQATPEAVECRTPSPRSLETPAISTIPERILRRVREYYTASFENGTWVVTDQDSYCYSRKPFIGVEENLDKFHHELSGATHLFRLGNAQEAGQFLISATEDIKDVLLAEAPRTLQTLLATVLFLDGRSTRETEILSAILRYFHDLGQVVLGETHPLAQITSWLASLSAQQLQEVAIKTLELIADYLTRILGPLHSSTLEARLSLIHHTARISHNDQDGPETMLQDILWQCDSTLGAFDKRTMCVRLNLAWRLLDKRKYEEAEREAQYMMNYEQERAKCPYSEELIYLLACANWALGNNNTALEYFGRIIQVYCSGSATDSTGRAKSWLVDLEWWLVDVGKLTSAARVREWRQTLSE